MRSSSWPAAVVVVGLAGTVVSLLAGNGTVPATAVVVPLALVPLSALALAFVGLARTGAIASYALVTVVAIAAPAADVWFRSVIAGNTDDATWLGLISGSAVTVSGLIAALARSGDQTRLPRRTVTPTS